MKNTQQDEAKNLYFQTNMSKTEIANATGVSRRTILRWCKEDNWEKLRQSSRHLPALVAEKCYYLIDAFTSRLLQDSLYDITLKDAQTIHLLASSIKKLKNRSTVNESMEMFNFFLEGLKKRNPQLATDVLPEIEEYIASRSDREVSDFLMDGFNKDGTMEYPDQQTEEEYADTKDLEALEKEIQQSGNYGQALENWQKHDTEQNPNPDEISQENEKSNNTISTNCTHSTAPGPVLGEVEVERAGARLGQKKPALSLSKCDTNGTFPSKKHLIINNLAKTKISQDNATFHTPDQHIEKKKLTLQ